MNITADQTWFNFVKVLIVAGMLSGMAMSPNLWFGERLLPTIPLINVVLPNWFHIFFAILLIAVLITTCLINSWQFPALSILTGMILIAFDQMRLQPWVYLYLFLLLPFALRLRDRQEYCVYYTIVASGLYWWSGLHKINPRFLDGNYSIWINFFFDYKFTGNDDPIRLGGYIIGVVEMSIGFGLVINQLRKIMVSIAVVMHLLIVTFLIFQKDFGDSAVIPWNIMMIAFDVVVFYQFIVNTSTLLTSRISQQVLSIIAIALMWICPGLNYIGKWDHFLSFSLYSNKLPAYYIAVHEDEVGKIDRRLWKYFVEVPGLSGGRLLDVYWWSKDELNVPFYPEPRVFRRLSVHFCKLGIPEGQAVFLEINPSNADEPNIRASPAVRPQLNFESVFIQTLTECAISACLRHTTLSNSFEKHFARCSCLDTFAVQNFERFIN